MSALNNNSPTGTGFGTFKLCTFRNDQGENQELDIKRMSQEDIRSLKKNDPFMYYSIPGIRRAAMFHEGVDISSKDVVGRPQIPGGRKFKRSKTVISRRRRISFEADALTVMEELLNNDDV